ncbi:MAG TPA: hypothetical protein PLN48_04415 [Lachnospiraceae bacterium]|jgi:hypothetical protein|nr:hypothetical protein [Lachnospiraceae bacterium]
MPKTKRQSFKSYYKEFRGLKESGCRLFYPEGNETTPKCLAETMAYDTAATYMRDNLYDQEGRVKKVSFMRIGL